MAFLLHFFSAHKETSKDVDSYRSLVATVAVACLEAGYQ